MVGGVPSVVTDVGGNGEVVLDGEMGYLVPLDGDGRMASKITGLLTDPDLASRIGRAAQQHVAEGFSVQGMMDAYCRLYGVK
jgi:L-malate glycosyltransferase